MGRAERRYRNADLLDEIGTPYPSTVAVSVSDAARLHGPSDLILEGTGFWPLVFTP
jgi:hypothetical protein